MSVLSVVTYYFDMAERSGNLSFIKYTNEQWVYVIEYGRESSIASQALVLSDDGFPHDRIKKLMELGKRVIHVRVNLNQCLSFILK